MRAFPHRARAALSVVNAPSEAMTGRPLIGDGANATVGGRLAAQTAGGCTATGAMAPPACRAKPAGPAATRVCSGTEGTAGQAGPGLPAARAVTAASWSATAATGVTAGAAVGGGDPGLGGAGGKAGLFGHAGSDWADRRHIDGPGRHRPGGGT